MGVKILGMKELNKNLDKTAKVLSKTRTEALEEIGQKGLAILKPNTPIKKGRLRGSMTFTINGKQEGLKSPASSSDIISKNDKKDIVILGTNVEYAEKVEFFGSGASKGYMLRSFNQIKKVIKPIMDKHFKKVLK